MLGQRPSRPCRSPRGPAAQSLLLENGRMMSTSLGCWKGSEPAPGGHTPRGRWLRRTGSESVGREGKEGVMKVNERSDGRKTERRLTCECGGHLLPFRPEWELGCGVPCIPPTSQWSPHVASLTTGEGRRQLELRSRLPPGAHRGCPHQGLGKLPSALCVSLPPGSPQECGSWRTGLGLSWCGGHPSWSDPIKMHDKGKKRVGQEVKGVEEAFVCSPLQDFSSQDKRGLGFVLLDWGRLSSMGLLCGKQSPSNPITPPRPVGQARLQAALLLQRWCFGTFLPPELLPSSCWGPEASTGDSRPWAGPPPRWHSGS